VQDDINLLDSSRLHMDKDEMKDWAMPDILESLRNKFVTGNWKKEAENEEDSNPLNDEEMDGSFEDFETGEKHGGFDGESQTENSEDEDSPARETDEQMRKRLGEEKAKKRNLDDDDDEDNEDDEEITEIMAEAKKLKETQV